MEHQEELDVAQLLGQDYRTFSVKVAYNGAPFAGFARQPGLTTVQGEIEQALTLLFKRPVQTVCAGRTDAGVHARGQVVSFDVSADEIEGRNLSKLLRSLNALTHERISLSELLERPQGFSARFDAVEREYHYYISTSATAPLFLRDFSWHIDKPLNVQAMRAAAEYLEGEHDFKSFCLAASAKGKPTSRFVKRVSLEETEIMGEPVLIITVVGNAFLHSMVRTIVGTLVKVGLGHREPEWVQRVLEACDRSAAGETAPAAGLVFWSVDYDGPRCEYAPQVK